MASNKFGVICDICGKYSDLTSSYYKMKLPTWDSEMNNSLRYLDYCSTCYIELKLALAKYYKMKWVENSIKSEG